MGRRRSRGQWPGRKVALAALSAGVLAATLSYDLPRARTGEAPDVREVSLTRALALLSAKKVATVDEHVSDTHPTRVFVITQRDGSRLFFRATASPAMESALSASGADVTLRNDDLASRATQAMSLLSSLLVIFVFGGILLSGIRRFLSSPARIVKAGRNPVGFADVAGQDEAKESLREIIDIARNRKLYADRGAKAPGGILLVGPPGCGKTLLAKAFAGESGMAFLAVAGSDFVELFAGLATRRWKTMWRQAKRQRNGCVLFIDEFEIIAGRRGASGGDVQSERDQLLNAMLVSLSGIEGRDGVILLAATNRPDILDPAITRPGRIDRTIHVVPPNEQDRVRMLEVHTRGMLRAPGLDLGYLAKLLPGFTGAQIANLANEARLRAIRARKQGVDFESFDAARDKVLMGDPRPLDGIDADELETCAAHEAGHALAANELPDCDPIHKASILPRGQTRGQVVTVPDRDRHMHSRRRIESMLVVLMAGRAAEEALWGPDRITSGAAEDIAEATRLARSMIGRFGMDPELGCMDYVGDGQGSAPVSPMTMERLDRSIQSAIARAAQAARSIIDANPAAHDAIRRALLERHTLGGKEIAALVAGAKAGAALPG